MNNKIFVFCPDDHTNASGNRVASHPKILLQKKIYL